MITELEKQVEKCTLDINKMILGYFSKKLEINDLKIITTLEKEGKISFNQKVNLFCDIAHMSQIDAAKFKVYTKINNEIGLRNNLLNASYLHNYFPFLINTYLSSKDVSSINKKLDEAISLLINDILKLTVLYIEKPEIYSQKKVKNIFSC